ncbi:unnamed protein product [Caenorhabditis brenneri]
MNPSGSNSKNVQMQSMASMRAENSRNSTGIPVTTSQVGAAWPEMLNRVESEENVTKTPRIAMPEDYDPKNKMQAMLMKRLKELFVHPMKYYIKQKQINHSYFEYENKLLSEVTKAFLEKRRPPGYPLAIAIVFMNLRYEHIAEFEKVEGFKVLGYTDSQIVEKLKFMSRQARKHGVSPRNGQANFLDNTADELEEIDTASNDSAYSSNAPVKRRESGAGSSNMSIPADDDIIVLDADDSMEVEIPERTDRRYRKNAQTTQNTRVHAVEMQRKKEGPLFNEEDKMEVDPQGAFGHDEADMSDDDIIVMDHDNSMKHKNPGKTERADVLRRKNPHLWRKVQSNTRAATGMQKENGGPVLNTHNETVNNAPDAFKDGGNIYVYSPDLCTFRSVDDSPQGLNIFRKLYDPKEESDTKLNHNFTTDAADTQTGSNDPAVLDYSPEMLIHGEDFEMALVPTSALKLKHIAKDTDIIEKYRRTEDVSGGLNWFFGQKAMFCSVEYHADCISNESLVYFLMKIETQVNEAVTINALTDEHFKYTFREPLEINLVYILQGTWVTVNNLYDMNSRHLHILGSNLTSQDMNAFLKNWLYNGNLKLVYLVVEMKLIDVDEILNGVDFERKEYEYPMRFTAQTATVDFTLSYDIKLTETVFASIVMTPVENKLFQMCVRSIRQY